MDPDPAIDSLVQAAAATGQELQLELISEHARIAGSVHLGAYPRLSDLLSFHHEILTVSDGVVLGRTGEPTGQRAPQLDIRLDALTLVIDRSSYVPPTDSNQAVEKTAHRMLAVTGGHVINATFFIYPSAEPNSYLRAPEPRWIPIVDVEITSLSDSSVVLKADFAVLQRKALLLSMVV